jgi:hypothetical protein
MEKFMAKILPAPLIAIGIKESDRVKITNGARTGRLDASRAVGDMTDLV